MSQSPVFQLPRISKAAERHFLVGLARAFAGAIIFSLPMMMTMEMWQLGTTVDPIRLSVFILAALPLLVGLSRFGGFERTDGILEDVADAGVALAVGTVSSSIVLYTFNIFGPRITPREIVGMLALQMVPAAIGALLARSQLGDKSVKKDEKERGQGYVGELFTMLVGALFLSFNIAPTEETLLIAYTMSLGHEVTLIALSLIVMHALVYSVQFKGGHRPPEGVSALEVFLRFTVTGYGLVLLVSLFMLWLFGRTDGLAPEGIISAMVVLAFPGALGAAAARLVL